MFGLALKSAIRKKLLLRAVSLFENQFVCGKFSSEYFHCFGPCIRQKKPVFVRIYNKDQCYVFIQVTVCEDLVLMQ